MTGKLFNKEWIKKSMEYGGCGLVSTTREGKDYCPYDDLKRAGGGRKIIGRNRI